MSQEHPLRSSPLLFGRDDLVALGRRRLQQTHGGVGELLFLAGEAGIGKTRLLDAIATDARDQGVRVVTAAVFPGDIELSGGLLLDLGNELIHSPTPHDAEIGAAVVAALSDEASANGDAHRRRRLMILEIVDRLTRLADVGPTMLAMEDLHWADDLTLEVIAQLARRLPALPLLAAGTYRSDELYPRVPMRAWRARLLGQRLAEEVRVRRLTFDEVSEMAMLLLGGPAHSPRELVESLHQRSDGIPLHIEELIGATTDGSPSSHLNELPDTLREAILQRRAGLSVEAAAIADAAAVIGRSFDLDLVAAVAGAPVGSVAPGIDEMVERAFVVPAAHGWYDFRHALIRDALESAIPLGRRRALHARVGEVVARRPDAGGDAYRSAQYEAAGMASDAHTHALSAAEQAVRLSSHREALLLFRRAVRCAPLDLAGAQLATLLVARAAEAEATDDNLAAAEDYERAHDLFVAAGLRLRAAEVVPRLAAVRHLLGDSLATRVEILERGLSELSSIGVDEADAAGARGRLEAGLSAAYMLDRRLDESIAHGEQALLFATAAGDETTELNVGATLGSVLVYAGRGEEGWPLLEDSVRRARLQRSEAEAARAYRMLSTSAAVLAEYERAEHWLREGIDYAERTEQWNHRHYMASQLGHVLWALGRWDEADDVTERAFADGLGGLTTTVTALFVRGYLALGRGQIDIARRALDEAREIGVRMGELQRLSPALWGLAELAMLEERWADAAAICREGRNASVIVRDTGHLFPFLVTGTRALLALGDAVAAERWVDDVAGAIVDRSIPGTLPTIDHARGLLHLSAGSTGQARTMLATARTGWKRLGRAWEYWWASIDLARCAYRANRPAEAASVLAEVKVAATDVGAVPILRAADELAAVVRRRGEPDVAWAPLTTREFEVAQRVAAGRTNREIAAELHISTKTAASHVEHILAKLGARRRAEIAAWVARVEPGSHPAL